MSRESFVMIIGVVVILLPSFGIPSDWKQYGFIGAGVLLMVLGYSLRRSAYLRTIDHGNGERGTDSFTESSGTKPVVTIEE